MPRRALTARFVETTKVKARTDYWDDVVRGLVLRVSPSGVKSWTVVYTRESDGRKRRLTLGKFPSIDLAKARKRALASIATVGDGGDPAGTKRARREGITVAELGTLFIEQYSKRHKRTWMEDERILKVELYPAIGPMKVASVKKGDLLDVFEAKAAAGRTRQSNQILAVARKMFGWAVEGEYIQVSPVAGIKPRGKAVRRDRVLSEEEVKAIWAALPSANISEATRRILRLLFLTGQRSGEVCGIRLDELDLDGAIWTIPRHRTKNSLAHVVPLSKPALATIRSVVDELPEEHTPDAPLFTRTGEPIASNAIAQAARKALQVTSAAWTPHDIRRTVATGMARLAIPPHIVEATLNHISGFRAGVAGVYNRHQYENEKRRALVAWANNLMAAIDATQSKIRAISR